jgi:hypothetical protein
MMASLATTMTAHEHHASKRRRVITAGSGCKSSLSSSSPLGQLRYNKMMAVHKDEGLVGEEKRDKATIN